MIFNSYTYFVFLTIVYITYRLINHRQQNYMLLMASYVFYGFWSVKFTSLLLISTVVDFYCGRKIDSNSNTRKRKQFLIISMCSNLGILGTFKYFDFFATSLSEVFTSLGMTGSLPLLNVVLPVGISFYTFQSMTYSIDIYRGRIKPIDNFIDFALFVSFFPQLVAGPIERAHHLLPQITSKRYINLQQTKDGLWLILLGLIKKAVVADNLAVIANSVFNNPTAHSGYYVFLGVYAFAFQIYCDFSGYTDIARGTAKLFGIDIMLNFRQPYFATSPVDFWRRWHISLSTWLRDYLYIPLGGNRINKTYRNLMITMVLGGLWHGAAMNFVMWGAYHGAILCIERRFKWLWQSIGDMFGRHQSVWKIIRIVFTFHLICIGWILFRVNNIADAWTIIQHLFFLQMPTSPEAKHFLLFAFVIIPIIILHLIRERRAELPFFSLAPFWLKANSIIYLLLMLIFWSSHDKIPFIYFQF